MANKSLLEVFDRDILLSHIDYTPERSTAFWDAGVFTTDGRISAQLAAGSIDFTVPYIVGIDTNLEANYSNTQWNDIIEPRGISGGRMKGMLAQLNDFFAGSKLAAHLNRDADELKYIGQDINKLWARQAEIRAQATMAGILNWDSEQDEQKFTITANNVFGYDDFVDVQGTMSDAYEDNGVMLVNRGLYNQILKTDAASVETRPSEMGSVKYYNGRRIIISKDFTEIDGKYVSYFLNSGAFIAESQAGQDDLEMANSAVRGNGGGYKGIVTRRDMLVHPSGFSFTGEILTGGTENEALFANWSDLQQAQNWDFVAPDVEQIPFRALITNKA